MGLFATALLLTLSPILQPSAPPVDRGFLLYLAQKGETERAIEGYREFAADHGHDWVFLRNLARVILKQGQTCSSEAGRRLALFGAGMVQDQELVGLLRDALFSSDEMAQIIAIDLLGHFDTDQADDLLLAAMGSPSALARLEAGLRLLEKGHPQALPQLQSLMAKLPKEAEPIFGELYAMASDADADAALRRLMATGSSEVNRAAVLSLARQGRDDFLPEVRRVAGRVDPLQQEAACVALGIFQDTPSMDRLVALSEAEEPGVRVAALSALAALDYPSGASGLRTQASHGDCFAIAALSVVPDSEGLLATLVHHADPGVRINAAIALLAHRDARCVPALLEVLITGPHDIGILPMQSASGALTCFERVPSLGAQSVKSPEIGELSCTIRESLLRETVELEENAFLRVAEAIFEAKQDDLIPLLARLLENHCTLRAVALMQRERHKPGAPLIRAYCNLALYRAEIQGPYGDNVRAWVRSQASHPLLELRPVLPWTKRRTQRDEFALTPEEKSRLLIESYEALAQRQDEVGIEALLDGIAKGHPDNRFALAALLMKAAE